MSWSIATKNDSTRDYRILPGGKLSLFRGSDNVRDRLKTKLQTFKGDWFLDQDHGIDYDGKIFGPGITQDEASAIIRLGILEVRGVLEIVKFSFNAGAVNYRDFFAATTVRVEATDWDTNPDTTLIDVSV